MTEYSTFIYKDYKIEEDSEKIYFKYEFEIKDLTIFKPEIQILKKEFNWKNLNSNYLKNIVFNLGMIEAISYFKPTCSRNFHIKCGYLNEEQKKWFRKIFFLGLGEFRYINNILTSEDEFVDFICEGNKIELEELNFEFNGIILPVGGGKDSNVTLELLKNKFNDINCFMVGSKDVSLECTDIAGFSRNSVIEINRVIDRNLLELNNKGFLNGHTPFSAMIAFLTYAVAFMLEKKYVVLSNESSANESNIDGEKINHQYSKTLEFENDFREYAKKFLKTGIEYFSFLRPISELQIAMLFSKYKKYHKIFKSCNVGSKQKPWVWCGECPKCLFVYIILSPFISKQELIDIFGDDLYEKKELLQTFIELCGFGKIKPFECVGTFWEVRYCVSKLIKESQQLPYLLQYYKENFKLEDTSDEKLLTFRNEHNLPECFENVLKENIIWN